MNQDYSELIKNSFKEHSVDNPQLEKAISDILNNALDPQNLSKRIWENVIEHYERNQNRRRRF